jgi:hypothetical protein
MRLSRVLGSVRFRKLAVLGVVLASSSCVAETAVAATAGTSFKPLSTDAFGTDQGPAPVNGVGDIAVSASTGNIAVVEQQTGTVRIWSPIPGSPGATSLTTVGLTGAVFGPSNAALDPGDDSLYIADAFISGGVERYLSDGAPTPTYTLDSSYAPGFFSPSGIAVDPTTHDLLVVDSASGMVNRVDSTGVVAGAFDGGGTLQTPTAVSVGPNGTIYVLSSGDGTVQTFSATGTPLGALAIPAGTRASAVAANPSNGQVAVFVSDGQTQSIQGFDSSGAPLFTAVLPASFTVPTSPPSSVSTEAHGLAWGPAGDRIYLSLGRSFVATLVSAVQAGVDAPAATSTGYNTAHVTSNVDPGGVNTTAWFEYCPASQQCSSYAVSNPADRHNPWKRGSILTGIAGSGDQPIADDLPLTSNLQWRIRVHTINDDGIASTSAATSYTTPLIAPVVQTGDAGSVTESGALLGGTIDPIGDPTSYHFEYGLTDSYGSRVPVAGEASAGSNRIPRTVSRPVSGLKPGTTYHFRLVATNSAGTTNGADRTFTTAGTGLAAAPARGYEQVTPVDKKGAQVRYDFHFQAAADGNAFVPVTRAASADADSSNLLENYITYRGADNWSQWQPTDPPLQSATGIFEATTSAISADFKHALVISNRVLAPGGIDGGGNLYIRDLRDNSYTFVAGNPGTVAFAGLANGKQNSTVLLAAAPDFSWIVFNLPRLQDDPTGYTAVYRWTRADGLKRESVLPDGTDATQRTQANGAGTQKYVSNDGKVVYFGLEDGNNGGALYRRENNQTIPVSMSHNPGFPVPFPLSVRLASVSDDGRYAVFYSKQGLPLTPDAPGGFATTNIFRYDSQTDDLVYVGNYPQSGTDGLVAAVSSDASTIYFGSRNVSNQPELYVWHEGDVRLVTTGAANQAVASRDGRYLAWVANDGTARRYDRDSASDVCMSCPVDGTPQGQAHFRSGEATISNRLPQVILDDGTVFFDTTARLVSGDHNGRKDVYAFKGGRATLISPGDGDFDSVFMDASVDGRDVFFATAQGLVGQDTDRQWDVYDARIGGGFKAQSPPAPPAPCVRSNCGELTSGPVASAQAPSSTTNAPTSKKTNQTKPQVRLGKVSFGAKTVRITFTASDRGRVTVSGTRVVKTVRNVSRLGTYTMTVKLSGRAQSLRRAHKRFKVSLRVTLYSGFGQATTRTSRTLGK